MNDLPDLHEQLLALTDRGQYVIEAARVVARLHDRLLGFPNADPRAAGRVFHEVVLGLRRGPLSSLDEMSRYDIAQGWLDNLWMPHDQEERAGG